MKSSFKQQLQIFSLVLVLMALSSGNGSIIRQKLDQVNSVNYDYSCIAAQEEQCLQNDIGIMGGKVVLVNLDDRCQLNKFVREGIFIQTGDYIIVTGRQRPLAGQFWAEPCSCYHGFDSSIVLKTQDFEDCVIGLPCYNQAFFILQGMNSGFTTFKLSFSWGGDSVREVDLPIYVNQQPTLAAIQPRFTCDSKDEVSTPSQDHTY
ncbi:UNKNOWN [Stylonychia lemnae]|uniref:Uncharacterized protein n=1 Tax=Stylonychia lemnae TaxID=5949 RepID=A0A078B5I5_STYLE|nr:UNKNOWN [Stylonychia lemnae]|eukprot:CDW88562.1 UNKNOWN [Stylonychia lemnae]